VFALTRPGEEAQLMQFWAQTAKDAGLESAHIYRPHIARQGLTVEVE
jgi:hypothetical protein